MKESLLPWAYPFFVDGMNTDQFSHEPPTIGSKVWVLCADPFFKEFYYLKGAFINGLFDPDSIDSSLSGISEISPESYPNMRFKHLPDGSIVFYGNEGNVGIYHNTGNYIVFDKTGKLIVSSTVELTLKTGDAAAWKPNILATDPFSGVPHGGVTAGIIKLKGN